MNNTILLITGFLCGAGYALTIPQPEIFERKHIYAAYEIGREECPPDAVCTKDDIGLVDLKTTDVRGMMR